MPGLAAVLRKNVTRELAFSVHWFSSAPGLRAVSLQAQLMVEWHHGTHTNESVKAIVSKRRLMDGQSTVQSPSGARRDGDFVR